MLLHVAWSGQPVPGWGRGLPGAGARVRGATEWASEDGRAVDAWAGRADEGRGLAAKRLGERRPREEPRVPEWSNPPGVGPWAPAPNA